MAANLHRSASTSPRDAERRLGSFGLFAETLFTGLLVAAFGVLLVTFIPAIAAGTSHLRRYLNGDVVSVQAFTADFRTSWRALWPLAVGAPVFAGVLVVNAVMLAAGVAPGGGRMVAVMVGLVLAVAVVSLRASAMWRPQTLSSAAENPGRPAAAGWAVVANAGRDSADDPLGSTLVVVAIGGGALLGWMFFPLLVVAPGLLALALVAAEHRSLARRAPGE